MRFPMILGVMLVCAAAAAQSETHTGRYRSDHFEVCYRPGSRAGAEVERTAAMAERELVIICGKLGVKPGGRYKLYLYDDVKEIAAVTGVKGSGGFSAGDSCHLPVGNDQTRFHELVHVIALARLKTTGSEPRSLFFAEGLANACLEFVHGVPVHAVAAFYLKRSALPPLSELAGSSDFYAWLGAHPGFNAYDVGASFFLYLLDAQGAKKTVRYYTGTPARKAFGLSMKTLEKRWHAALRAFELRPEVDKLLAERHGGGAEAMKAEIGGLPPEILGRPEDWKSLARASLEPLDDASWSWVKDELVGESGEGRWSICLLGKEALRDCAVRARVSTEQPVPIQLRLGEGNQAMLVNGTFLYREDAPHASSSKASMHAGRRTTDFVLVRRGGAIEIWIDGVRALATDAEIEPARVGVGFHQGRVVFSDIRVRKLP